MNNKIPDLKHARRQRDAAIDLSKLDRLPPHSIEAEQGVLGCVMLDPRASLGTCAERIRDVSAFYDLRHQTLYEALLALNDAGTEVDLITARQRLKDKGQLAAIGGVAYLTTLVDATPSPANLPFYLDIMEEKFLLRRMSRTCSEVVARIYTEEFAGDVDQLLDEVEREVLAIRRQEVVCDSDMKQHVLAVIAKKEQDQSGVLLRGLSTGLPTLDRYTRGLKAQNMVVVAARPSVGKTSLAMQMAERVALDDGKPVAIFSLEMSAEELTELVINRRARLTHSGALNEAEMQSFMATTAAVSRAPMFIVDQGGLTIGQIQAAARRLHQRHTLALIVVDYLQLVRASGRKENRATEVGEVSMGLKALAKELNIPVVVLAQLNRDCDRENRMPRMSDLRESGSIEADADIVILLHTEQDNGEFRDVTLKVEKNRGSRRGKIDLVFNGPLTEFREQARVESEDVPEHRSRKETRHRNDD